MISPARQLVNAPATRDIVALPKGHLHIHLEGAMRPTTLRQLAEITGIGVPPIRGFKSFKAFAGMYDAACRVLVKPCTPTPAPRGCWPQTAPSPVSSSPTGP